MHWKIARDPYFAPLCARYGEEAVMAAGFFFDEDPEPQPLDDVNWLSTPFPRRPVRGERPVVLLATGGFHPVHAGHLDMMERARMAAESAGLSVVGGYLSPGHDAYLRMKCGAEWTPAHQRLKACVRAIEGSEWLSMDPWEALHRRVAVNYTDVTARLQAYLQARVDPRLEVVYVCGGDNARFALAFTERGRCIVVARPGAEGELEIWRGKLGAHPNVTWVDGNVRASSREIRAGTASEVPKERPRVVVRLEDERAVKTLGIPHLAEFQARLVEILGRHAVVRLAPLRGLAAGARTISLDAMLPAAHNLALSRLFGLGGYEAFGHVARPGAPPLAEQVGRIPDGEYMLADDDSVTGRTLAAARTLLSGKVEIREVVVAVEHERDEDVLDARDFLLGADDGGLVLALAEGAGRAPYLLPYVDPAARASIGASHAFSIEVWRLNALTFRGTAKCVRDLPRAARAVLPFPDDARLDDVCEWHAARLERLLPPPSPA